jgi:glycosyltransferase involved in cell wall biosynthesis
MSGRPVLYEVMLLGSGSRRLAQVGSDSRELDYYRYFSRAFDVWIFEYDVPADTWLKDGVGSLPRRFRQKYLQSTLGVLFIAGRAPAPAIIRTKQFWGAWTGVLLKLVTGRPLVIRMGYHWSHNVIVERHIKSDVGHRLMRGFERALARRADALIFGSSHIARAFDDLPQPSIVVPNGINHERFIPGHAPYEFDLIFVGRLIPVKGFDRLMRLVPASLRLCVIGRGPGAHLLASRPRTRWIEHVPNDQLAPHLRSARCFISLSRTEGSPKALLEGIFCGCYPILSDIAAHRELVHELGYGTLLQEDATGEQIALAAVESKTPIDALYIFRERYRMDRLVEVEAAFLKQVLGGV